MANNFFITGMPKAGKTTLLMEVAKELKSRKLRIGGFISPEEKVHGPRTGFMLQDLRTGKGARLAAIDIDGPKVAKYHVDIRSFESFIQECFRGMSKFDVVFIDEIGRMEMKSARFQDLLARLLESSVPLVATLHRDYLEDYKAWGTILNVTPSNRQRVRLELLKGLKAPPERPEHPDKPFKPMNGPPKKKKPARKKAKTPKAKGKKKPLAKRKARAKKKPAAPKEGILGWLKKKLPG